MKRIASLLMIVTFFAVPAFAEETTAPTTETVAAPETAPAVESAPAVAEAPAPVEAPAPAPAVEAPAVVPPTPVETPAEAPVVVPNTENLEFISGEISELDEAGKTLTVKLYGEAENAASDKTLKVNVDANTDITDGEQDRDLKSLTVGTEVDVEYDPATAKATYIFVY